MTKFSDENFMLSGEAAHELYEGVKDLPIFDYHCHLSPKEIYEDRRFENLGELWLEADHYKWRLMRQAGIDEKYITGDASFEEKFFAFANAMPLFAGNPVYHWVHLELKKYFGITDALCADTARGIWEETSRQMSGEGFSARTLIKRSGVETVVTTDDPTSDLEFHKLLRGAESFSVLPCFRADRVLGIEKGDFDAYICELERVCGKKADSFDALADALRERLDFFETAGCPAMDVSFENFPAESGDVKLADAAFKKARAGETITESEAGHFKAALLKMLAVEMNRRDMVIQLHTGVIRNVNGVAFGAIGADSGIDSIGAQADISAAGRLLDAINREGGLPKTIVYTLNRGSYYPLATLLGDFAGRTRGRVQLGAAWWFMDNADGIREQLKIFANTLAIGTFNGMLTDSRSFTSYARHDYFRRILCSVVGGWIDNGEYPSGDMAKELVKDVCYFNAKNFFGGDKA